MKVEVLEVNMPAVEPTVKGVPLPDKVVVPEPALNSVLLAMAKTLLVSVMVIVGLFADPSTTAVVCVPSPKVALLDMVKVPEPSV